VLAIKLLSYQNRGIEPFGVCCIIYLESSYTQKKKTKLILVFFTMINIIEAGYGNGLMARAMTAKEK
jgi:hypothetical protein